MLASLVALLSCRTEYSTQHFSFPPGSKPHENDWKYTGLVIVSSRHSPIAARSKKHIRIRIFDKARTEFLDDSVECDCASVRANAVWQTFDDFAVELVEVGNPFRENDPYNADLVKTGPRHLFTLRYRYSEQAGGFKQVSNRAGS
jgi:hypothetical protein